MTEKNIRDAVSSGSNKIKFEWKDGKQVVKKKTTGKEYAQWSDARRYLQGNPIFLCDNSVEVQIAPMLAWDSKNSIVTMPLLGVNMEMHIKCASVSDREHVLRIFKAFLGRLQEIGFLWGEPAPRNLIYNQQAKRIFLVDFERELVLKHAPVSSQEFSRYICTYALEEFGAVLLEQEQNQILRPFLRDEGMALVYVDQIASRRKRALLDLRYGKHESYRQTDIRCIEELMLDIVSPYPVDAGIFYPLEIIDPISEQGGPHDYAQMAVELSRLDRADQFIYLQRRAAKFGIQNRGIRGRR